MTDEPHDVAADLALGAFRLVRERLSLDLDFTPETLPFLDHYLAQLREDEGGVDQKVLGLVAPCAGAYFGEVCRRSLAGLRWHQPDEDYPRWRIEGERVFVCFNPIGQVIEALRGEAVTGWNAHFTLLPAEQPIVDESLDRVGGVREDDYFRLAVRHEVLEQTMVTLSRLQAEKGDAIPHFGPEVYRAAIDQRSAEAKA